MSLTRASGEAFRTGTPHRWLGSNDYCHAKPRIVVRDIFVVHSREANLDVGA